MKSRINQLLTEIENRREELKEEYTKLRKKYNFEFLKWKIIFSKQAKEDNKKKKKSLVDTIFSARVREILSIPFIYGMIIPALILDIFLFVFQQTAFRLYKIPLVKRRDYIVWDRKHLDYLNPLQKLNCLYCSYVNGIFSFAVEVWGRTEKYWCPIKHARKLKTRHGWQKHFADYGDAEGFKDVQWSSEEFYTSKK